MAVVQQAQDWGASMRRASDAVEQPNDLAEQQLMAVVERSIATLTELRTRASAGLDTSALRNEAARTFRALHGWTESPTRKAAYLAATLTTCANLSRGMEPMDIDPIDAEALRLAVRVQGIAVAARAQFAMMYPEDADRIDRASWDRLVTAWTSSVEGGRWPVIADVWKRRFNTRLAWESIKSESRKLPR